MADNVAITAGSGTTIGTDEVTIGAVLQHVQRVKLVDGADGGTALIGGDATNGLDVDVTRVTGTVATGGDTANDAVDAGNPVKVGGIASAAVPTAVSADGDRVAARYTTTGAAYIIVTNLGGSGAAAVGAAADASSPGNGLVVQGQLLLWNGTTWDRGRGDSTGGQHVQGAIAHDAADTGNPVKIGGKAAITVPTAATAGDRVNAWMDLNGRQIVTMIADTATLSNVAGSASSVTVLAANTGRKGAMVVNDSTSICYLKYGSTASSTSYTVKMTPDSSHVVQFGYTGILTGIWVTAAGNSRVTEVT